MQSRRKAAIIMAMAALLAISQAGLVAAEDHVESGTTFCGINKYLNTRSNSRGTTEHYRPNSPTYRTWNYGPYWYVGVVESTNPAGGGNWTLTGALGLNTLDSYAYCIR